MQAWCGGVQMGTDRQRRNVNTGARQDNAQEVME
jgi:hypothetical protein